MCAKNAGFCAKGFENHEEWHKGVPQQFSKSGLVIPLLWTQKGRPMSGVSHRSKQGTCMASSRYRRGGRRLFKGLRPLTPGKEHIMNEKSKSIYTRVSPQEKQKIVRIADRCGLSVSEYIRQRCLGYAPRELPTEDLYWICDYLRDCKENGVELGNEAIENLILDIRTLLILPGRDL